MSNKVTLIGISYNESELTLRQRTAVLKGKVFLQTDKLSVSNFLLKEGISFETMDEIYDTANDFDALSSGISEKLLKEDCIYILAGSVSLNSSVRALIKNAKEDTKIDIILSDATDEAVAKCMLKSKNVCFSSVISTSARMLSGSYINTREALFIGEVETVFSALDLKIYLSKFYDDKKELYFFDGKSLKSIPLFELDRQKKYSYLSYIVILPDDIYKKKKYEFNDLSYIMSILYSENGCPWDKEQTHESLRQYLIEESYEVLDAIDKKDMDSLADELGDVLLQVVFHAKIAEKFDEFSEADIFTAICRKMINRHPHIFSDVNVSGSSDVVKNWDAIKREEKNQNSISEALNDVPSIMPSLMKSLKVQKKAANFGFDFKDAADAAKKVNEELKEVFAASGQEEIEEEIGDLLFSVVNVARKLHVNPEIALVKNVDKFIGRISKMESKARNMGLNLNKLTLAELDRLYNEIKEENA